tara:strand:+ start:129 stop:404 length:276 start_codon:yes stop_codon:yes gene_type:complete
MRDSDKFLEAIDDMIEILTGKRPNRALEKEMRMIERNGDRRSVDRGTGDRRSKPKRARGKKGKFLADNKMTKDFNEAWVGGKAPKKKMRKK